MELRLTTSALSLLVSLSALAAQQPPYALSTVRSWVSRNGLTAPAWTEEETLRGLVVASRTILVEGGDLRTFVPADVWSGEALVLVDALRNLTPGEQVDVVLDRVHDQRYRRAVEEFVALLSRSEEAAESARQRFEEFVEERPELVKWQGLGSTIHELVRWETGAEELGADTAALVLQWDPDADRRLLAAQVLGDVSEVSPGSRAAIARAVGDRDDEVAREALIVLQRWGVTRSDEASALAAAATSRRVDLRALARRAAEQVPERFQWQLLERWEAAARAVRTEPVTELGGVWIVPRSVLWDWGVELMRGKLPLESRRVPVAHVRVPGPTVAALLPADIGDLRIVGCGEDPVETVAQLYGSLSRAWTRGERCFRMQTLTEGESRELVVYIAAR